MFQMNERHEQRMTALLDLLAEPHHLAIYIASAKPGGIGITNYETGTYRQIVNLWTLLKDYLDGDDAPEAMAQTLVFMAPGNVAADKLVNPFTPAELRELYNTSIRYGDEPLTDPVEIKADLVETCQSEVMNEEALMKRKTKAYTQADAILTKLSAMQAAQIPPLLAAAKAAIELVG